jgi:hypothetical protein
LATAATKIGVFCGKNRDAVGEYENEGRTGGGGLKVGMFGTLSTVEITRIFRNGRFFREKFQKWNF